MEILDTTVAVVGGGIAGMIAAVGIAQHGHSVIVLEQSEEDRYPCNSRLTGGVLHCALRPPDLAADHLEKIIVRNRGADVNEALAKAVAHDVLPAIRWLQALGVRFIRGSGDAWHHFVLAPPSLGRTGDALRGRGGDALLRRLETDLNGLGSGLRRGSRAGELVFENGVLAGVRGDDFIVRASIVIIADGGYQAEPGLVRQTISPDPLAIAQRNAGTGHGDGLAMARAAGAALAAGQSGFYGHVVSRDALTNPELRFYPWLDDLARAGIAVTADGRRFCDESRGGIHLANQIAALPNPAAATVIWDNEIWEGPGRAGFISANPFLMKKGATIFRAERLTDLALQAGIDATKFVETVAGHNASVMAQPTARPGSSRVLRHPPYWAAPAAAGMTYTMGGLAVDGSSRVISEKGEPISGLFAIGGASGGIEGGPKTAYVGGLAKAVATGWRAAKQITADIAVQ